MVLRRILMRFLLLSDLQLDDSSSGGLSNQSVNLQLKAAAVPCENNYGEKKEWFHQESLSQLFW